MTTVTESVDTANINEGLLAHWSAPAWATESSDAGEWINHTYEPPTQVIIPAEMGSGDEQLRVEIIVADAADVVPGRGVMVTRGELEIVVGNYLLSPAHAEALHSALGECLDRLRSSEVRS